MGQYECRIQSGSSREEGSQRIKKKCIVYDVHVTYGKFS